MSGKEKEKESLIEKVGAIKAFKMVSGLSDAARYGLYKQIRDAKMYEAVGKDWKTFCAENLGKDQKTINDEIKLLESFGESFISIAEQLGLRKKDLYSLDKGFSAAEKIAIKEGCLMNGATKIPITKEHHSEVTDVILKLVDKTREAEAQATQAKNDLEAKYNTSKAWEKKYIRTQKELEEAQKQIKQAQTQLQFSTNPDARTQQEFIDAIDQHFLQINPIFLFLDNNVSNMQKLKEKKGTHYPPMSEASILTFAKYIFEMARLYYESLEHIVGIPDGEKSAFDDKYIAGLEKEVKDHWANMLYPNLYKEDEEDEEIKDINGTTKEIGNEGSQS